MNPGESASCQSSAESMEASARLVGEEASMNIIEIEGPLLSDAHVAFRVLLKYIFTTFNLCVDAFKILIT